MLKELCSLNGTSGDEKEVRNFIIENIKNKCDYKVDALGSVIAFKKVKRNLIKKLCFVLIWTR